MTLQNRGFLLLSLLCAALACLPLLPGLPGGFVFDDVPNIVENSGVQLESLSPPAVLDAAFSNQPGGHTRILPTLTFALDFYRTNGFDPATFKLTNIGIHALTTLALAWLLCELLLVAGTLPARARWIALALALAWAVHPLQVSSVLYVVQRMQTMATLFLVLALLSYLKARQAQIAGNSGRTAWMLTGLLWVLAIACKEDAALLPMYMLALELTVLRFRAHTSELSRKLKRGYMLLTIAGAAAYIFVFVPHYWSWDSHSARNFSSAERLLTQGRVLCMYLWEILLPLPSHMTFYYDWMQPSRGLLQPWTTVLSLGLLLALLRLAWHLRHRRPLFALGIFIFFAGHFITSNVITLELAFEHRNHFPLIGIVLAVGDLLVLAATRLSVRSMTSAASCTVLLVVLASTTAVRAHSWNSSLAVAQTSTKVAPTSARAWNSLCLTWFELGGGTKHNNTNLSKAIAACGKAADVDKNSIVGLTNVIAFKTIQGTITAEDWDYYLNRLQQVPMTAENSSAIWVILNKVRDGMPVDGSRVFEAIEITNHRRPFRTIESAAIGYFIFGHTQQPNKAYPYFAHAVQSAKDPAFSQSIIDDLRKEGRDDWANQLEVMASNKSKQAIR